MNIIIKDICLLWFWIIDWYWCLPKLFYFRKLMFIADSKQQKTGKEYFILPINSGLVITNKRGNRKLRRAGHLDTIEIKQKALYYTPNRRMSKEELKDWHKIKIVNYRIYISTNRGVDKGRVLKTIFRDEVKKLIVH